MLPESLLKKLNSLVLRKKDLEDQLSSEGATEDISKFTSLNKEYSEITPVVELYGNYNHSLQSIQESKEMLDLEDKEIIELAKQEIEELESSIEIIEKDLKLLLLPKDNADDGAAYLEIRAGAGGDEAALFASDIFRMYQRYSELKSWKLKILSQNDTGVGGIKEVTFEISGEKVYQRLHLESGVHRVQRVPSTESQGRIHTSTITVAVLPKAEEIDVEINENDIKIDVFHSGGAGGQNVNKVATAIRITHEPSGIVVQCQNERSQLQNKLQALEILRSRLWDSEIRKQRDEISANRKSQVGTGDRSEKIRTYNFPQSRITDHRININSHQMAQVLDGDLDVFIDPLLQEEQAKKLASLESNTSN